MYVLYGHPAIEHADDNSDLDPGAQRASEERIVHTTESREEAAQIRAAGGFIRDDKWIVVTRGVDSSDPHAQATPVDDTPRKSNG